jgi:hypothetical protein
MTEKFPKNGKNINEKANLNKVKSTSDLIQKLTVLKN